jgi:hypothetical protein
VVDDRNGRPETRRRRRRVLVCLIAASLVAAATAIASESGSQRAHASALRAPGIVGPANDTVVNALPAFSWRRVRGATKYEFQFSADARFRSTMASFDSVNTSATVDETVFDGDYYWRVRAVDATRTAGKWSAVRTIRKRWAARPDLVEPASGAKITFPSVPLVLRWSPTPYASSYEVVISTDPTLAGNVVGNGGQPIETSGNAVSVPPLSPGRYYWAVSPLDAGGLKGRRSEIASFDWEWPSKTGARVNDLWGGNDSIVDPQFDWDPVPGAAKYDVEVNSSEDFAPGSKVCCNDPTTGLSLAPKTPFPNNTYYWRVRARDVDGNAGEWNRGPDFVKFFVPGAPNLRLRDNVSDSLPAGSPTSSPVIAWDPVPGASSYEVNVVPGDGGCNWSTPSSSPEYWDVFTSSTAWTALGYMLTSPIDNTKPLERDIFKGYESGHSYCVRVRSRGGTDTSFNRVYGDWSYVGGIGNPAFTYTAPSIGSPPANPNDFVTPAGNYLSPAHGSVTQRMPLFTWTPVAGACQYVVGVFTDETLSKLVEQAVVAQPAYAPRIRTYPDETTSYYWAALPVKESPDPGHPCNVTTTAASQNNARSFQKRSVPPVRLLPGDAADVTGQPMFRWTGSGSPGVEAAREYQLQVATDDSFGNPLEDVKTAATAFTSSQTYPADTELFWRVRANDEEFRGLAWSTVGTFRRRLPIPTPNDNNPTRGEDFPVLKWAPVPGAVSYDVHVEEEDGDKNDFTYKTTAASFIKFYGLGVFRWQVRANFPKLVFGTVPSGWSAMQSFTRFIDPPPNARLTSGNGHVLLTWDPSPAAFRYRVDISETNSFNQLLDSHTTDNTNYAPRMNQPGFANGGRLYWRVAAMDEGRNVGGFATGSLKLPRGMRITLIGFLQKGKASYITVSVLNANGKPVRRALVRSRGAGSRPVRRRTNRAGTARLRIRPRRRGNVLFTVRKRGFRTGTASMQVR